MRRRQAREILGVDENASEDAIKRAFRRYALQHHPDRNPNNPDAEEAFKKGAHAYRVLTGRERSELDSLFDQFEKMEHSFEEMKQAFDDFEKRFDEFEKNMSEGFDKIESSFSRMFKWTVILLISMTVALGVLIWFGGF